MHIKNILLIAVVLLLTVNCGSNTSSDKIEKLADGVFKKEGWIYDMKELPSGKNVIPFYTIGKLSSNTLLNYFTDPPSEMGITLYAILDKKGENKNKITAIHLESTASDENLFKFPRCLSVCPIIVEIIQANGTVVETKTTYSRPNVFKMELEDKVLREMLIANNSIRMRIPISRNNQNTTFEWFEFDFSGFTQKL